MLVYLRFADLVTETVAKLTTGSGGLTPGRAGFAPAGQQTKFHGVIAIPPIPIDQQSLVALIDLSSAVARAIPECLELPARAPPLAPASAEPPAPTPNTDEAFDFDQTPTYEEA